MNITCFGFGQVAKNFIKKIYSENLKINLTVTSRDKSEKKKVWQFRLSKPSFF